MRTITIAINGFGRIGRTLFRLLHSHPHIQVVAVNDVAPPATLAHLLKYDSIHGVWAQEIEVVQDTLTIDKSNPVLFSQHIQPQDCNWKALNVDIVIEATGKFKEIKSASGHLKAGAKKVILSAPPDDNRIKTVVMGVNEHIITPEDTIISNASCTTNNAAPMIAIIDALCGIEQAYITTVHSYTTDQSLHDQPHRDLRRARAAGQSIVPTTTGAAKALTRIFPHLSNSIGGCGIRVPVPNGSLTDITFNVQHPVSISDINQAFQLASTTSFQGILSYTEDPIVSIDVLDNPHSCIFDAQMTSVIEKMVKIIGWYDNEAGYSHRIIDLILFISKN